jgi:hypothetical protein
MSSGVYFAPRLEGCRTSPDAPPFNVGYGQPQAREVVS